MDAGPKAETVAAWAPEYTLEQAQSRPLLARGSPYPKELPVFDHLTLQIVYITGKMQG